MEAGAIVTVEFLKGTFWFACMIFGVVFFVAKLTSFAVAFVVVFAGKGATPKACQR